MNALDYWLYGYKPGPATINGISNDSSIQDAGGAQARVGDRLYATFDEGEGIDKIAYMQVIEVGTENVVVDMWVWNRS